MSDNQKINTGYLVNILENIQGGIILCNYNPTTQTSEAVYANHGWTEITGYTMEQLNAEKGGNPQALIFPDENTYVDAEYAHQQLCGDTYGHGFGDKVLTAVAQQMKSLFHSGDVLGRVGGDEFMVFMAGVSDEKAILEKTRELCSAISDIKIPNHKHKPITVSVGISFFWWGKLFETMIAEADAALYRAKGQGKNQCCIWREQE